MNDITSIELKHFEWINEPKRWILGDNFVEVVTDENTDFWQKTWYKFRRHSGHMFGVKVDGDFIFEACIEAEYSHLYDQAGVMILADEGHWLKAGVEYSDGRPMISSVLTDGTSDWATGWYHRQNTYKCVFAGDPAKFWMRLAKVDASLCVKYSHDRVKWHLSRLCPFPRAPISVGVVCCTPQRAGLTVKFSDFLFSKPSGDILHSN